MESSKGAAMSRAQLQPPIIRSAIIGWRDAFESIGSMPVPAVVGLVIMLVLDVLVLDAISPLNWARHNTGGGLDGRLLGWCFAWAIVQSFVMTPLAIAVHRFILLGEVTNRYLLNPLDPRFRRFFGLGVALILIPVILIGVPGLVMTVVGTQGPWLRPEIAGALSLMSIIPLV